jgi:hypothetical protein
MEIRIINSIFHFITFHSISLVLNFHCFHSITPYRLDRAATACAPFPIATFHFRFHAAAVSR